MTEPICTLAIGLAGLSLILQLIAALSSAPAMATAEPKPSSAPLPVMFTPEPAPRRISLQFTRKELYDLCRDHKIKNGYWRARARKTEMVQALCAAGVTHG